MNSKERVLATMRHEPTDRTPIDCWLYQKQFVEKLEVDFGPRDRFWDEFNIDINIGFVPWPNQLGKKVDVTELENIDLGDPRDPRWLEHNNWADDFAGSNIKDVVARYGDRRAVIAHIWGMVEGTSSFLGIENCWRNLAEQPSLMLAWFNRYAEWLCGLIDSLAGAGVDAITLSDDWGSNKTMLFSPRMWRRMIKPYAARVVQHARRQGLPVNLHSDGYIWDIIDDLFEIGYTSHHPVQESSGMVPASIKEKYRGKLVIYGSLDVIDGLLKYDHQALTDYITKRFEVYAPGGGFIFNSGHFVQPDIPPLRLVRAYETVNVLAPKYGA